MSFYNPNIQRTFEDDNREFIKLKGLTFGIYKIIYQICDGCTVKDVEDLRAKYQLEYVCFDNLIQEQNLRLIDDTFPALLADIALEVMTDRVKSPWDYIVRNEPFQSITEQHKALYAGDKIQDFIELLVYSDIASKHISKGERDFTKIFKRRITTDELEFFSLFERLKLYDYLKRKMRLEIDRAKSEIVGREVKLFFRMSV